MPDRHYPSLDYLGIILLADYSFLIAACAAAKRAIGTRNGEQDT